MKWITPLLFALLITACQSGRLITYPVVTTPVQPLQPAPQKVLVLHTFKPSLYTQRKNKESLVALLTDTLVKQMSAELEHSGLTVEAIYGITPVYSSADDSTILRLIQS